MCLHIFDTVHAFSYVTFMPTGPSVTVCTWFLCVQ